jgi:cation-transporting ATPase 13A1
VKIVERFHFASKLQRMSVVCRLQKKGAMEFSRNLHCLVKGSPEAILKLLRPHSAPEWYEHVYRVLAEEGMRVLALAHKPCDDSLSLVGLTREQVECDLSFVGFIAFECKTRADSGVVIQSLVAADHKVK